MTNNINSTYGNTTAERIKWLRKKHGMSRQDLFNKILENYPNVSLSYSTLQGWERGKMPRPASVEILCSIFECTQDFIICESTDPILTGVVKTLSIQDLMYYDAEPVMIMRENKEGFTSHDYALVNYPEKCLVFKDGSRLLFDNIHSKTVIAARNLYSSDLRNDPISLELAKSLNKVYIKELKSNAVPSMYEGYYSYNAHTDCFEKEDQTIFLKSTAYNISFTAYAVNE